MSKQALIITVRGLIKLALINKRTMANHSNEFVNARCGGEYDAYIHAAKIIVSHARITGQW